jgi:coenzyme PQQ synthesis protein D (PqqD)
VEVRCGRIDGAGTSMMRWERNERTLWRAGADGSLVVLSPTDEQPHVVHGSGAALWRALAEPRTTAELAAELASAFGVEPDVIARDIEPVLAALVEHGAARRVP